jgi:hypothetical protein
MKDKQRVLSSYFSQPAKSSATQTKSDDAEPSAGEPIDLTLSDSDPDSREPPAKRTRIERAGPSDNNGNDAASSSPPPAHSLMSQKWSFTPVTGTSKTSGSNDRPVAEVEAFRKKMGGSTSSVPAKTGKGTKRQRMPVVVDDEQCEGDKGEVGSEDAGENDEVPSQLSKFANTNSRKAGGGPGKKGPAVKPEKGAGSKRGTKKVEEVGPAGLKYTPLEKQVRSLFAGGW